MNKYICVKEAFEYIYIGHGQKKISLDELRDLQEYLEKTIPANKNALDIKHNKFRFINYVGIISINNFTIEIIPKISLSNDEKQDKKILLDMLSKCSDIELSIDNSIDSNIEKCNLIELIANKYLDSLIKELNKGNFHDYINKEENIKVVRGKIMFNKHIKKNNFKKGKIFCSYDEYSDDNLLNQTFKLACIKILNKVQDIKLKNKTKKSLSILGNVSNESKSNEIINNIKLNNQNKRFSNVLQLAKFILLNLANENSSGSKNGFSMLFEMNDLFEKYIGKIVQMLCCKNNKKAITQDKRNYLLIDTKNNKKSFNLKPDIVIEDNNIPFMIIDTKWKAVEYNSKSSYQVSDIYQMYAYANAYKQVKKVILLYPSLGEEKEYPSWKLINDDNKFIEVKTVRLDSYKNTVNDLEKIIYD
ncbi:hypothetical protein JMF89_09655 [Clostridiaceae bacterium UIB06]|uniref:Restriction endonuclease n=1 Tax=Clostridium thailandense TaxID=2794346 RepID=A0A949WR97_9CLOT|nr:McrC family protein [Clostridium thailandense]MBV7273755.1 hypothetical protein [Clostridium thailandense]MCH5137465.1 hypothetical protein [Clostridiaceae bacterium UIB06]